MSDLEHLIKNIRHSPRLPEVVALLQRQIDDERQRRGQFYREMTPEQKVEFIDGEIVLHSPARNRHLDVTKWVLKLLDTYVSTHQLGQVKFEKCLCVFPRNDYEPDIVYFGREKASSLSDETLLFPVPDLIVEVLSESTEARDRGVKFEDYAANGVEEYWIVDADRSCIEQYFLQEWLLDLSDRFLAADQRSCIEQYLLHSCEYQLAIKSSTGTLASRVIEGFQVDIEACFDSERNLTEVRRLLNSSS